MDVTDALYLVPHDAYQYFEARIDRPVAGAISLSDGAAPSPTRIFGMKGISGRFERGLRVE